MLDLRRVQAPRPDAPEQIRVAELVLARRRCRRCPERAVVPQHPVGDAGVDHASDRVVPEILLVGRARIVWRIRIAVGADEIAGMAAADPGRLHPPVGGEVGRPEAESLHARRRRTDRLDVGDAAACLEDGVEEDRPGDACLRLELGDDAVPA